MAIRDFYEVLGVAKDAGPDDLKKAFRKLAMQHHPDRNPGDASAEQKFREVAGELAPDPLNADRLRLNRLLHQTPDLPDRG